MADVSTGKGTPRKSGRFFRRTFLVAFALIGAGLISSAALEMGFRFSESLMQISERHAQVAEEAAFKIRGFIHGIESAMRATAHSQEAIATGLDSEMRFELLTLLKIAPAISTASIIRSDGREVAKVSRLSLVNPADLADRSAENAFKVAIAGETYFSRVFFVRDSEPHMRLATPIEWFAGRVEGVIVAEISLKYAREVVSQIVVGDQGYVYVVSGAGELIAHPDLSFVLGRRNISNLAQVKLALEGGALAPESHPNMLGESIFPAYAVITDLGWAVLAETPASEVYAPLLDSLTRTALLSIAALAAALLASLLVVRKVVNPLSKLRDGAVQFGAGDLHHRIDLQSGDEFEDVSEAFNRMADGLNAARNQLEDQVAERTHELRVANAKLEEASHNLADWNRTLEDRVAKQVGELDRMAKLKRFVAPQLADAIVSSGDDRLLESHRREITVVFADLRGFTKFSETAEPERLMSVLHEYHRVIGELIFAYEATLERFAGDGVMVYLNDPLPCPDPAGQAVRLGVAMRDSVRELTDKWRGEGDQLDFGVGIALGYATLGQIGFDARVDYAAIGPVTNLASRLCDEAAGGQILVSQRIQAAVSEIAETDFVGDLSLKGFSQPVSAYNVITVLDDPSAISADDAPRLSDER